MPYLMTRVEGRHETCTKPIPKAVSLGSVWQCDVCGRMYTLKAYTRGLEPTKYWSCITPRQARRLIEKYQKRTGPYGYDIGPL